MNRTESFSRSGDQVAANGLPNGWERLAHPGWPDRWHPLEQSAKGLVIRPRVSSWYEDIVGGLLYRERTGDFAVTARVKVNGRDNGPPNRSFSLGGLMVRAPLAIEPSTWQPGRENWLFLTTGTADRPGEQQFEAKTTYQSVSTLRTYPAPTGWVDLRIVRTRELFTLFYRPDGGVMTFLDQWVRPDLPQTLQVGIIAYTDWDTAGKYYPDFKTINEGLPGGVEDLVMTVQNVTWGEPIVDRFGTRLTDFASLGEAKIRAMGAE